jgi:capsular polysaccharide biosynthesis protein
MWDRCVVLDSRTVAVCRLLTAPSLAHDAPAWACEYVRNLLGPKPAPAPRRKIYVLRGQTARRRILNEEEVCAIFQRHGFEIFDCSNLPICEQAALFAESQFIAGAHGAAFSNLVFCQPGASVLEIFATPQNQKTYWLVSHHMQLRYHYLMANPVGDGNAADMTVDPALLARYLDTLLAA